jgi:hypothetical protein
MPENPTVDRSQWNMRADGTPKGDGFLGILQRPDGMVSSELSIPLWERGDPGDKDYAKGPEIPMLVPTLTKAEVQYLLNGPVHQDVPKPIADKAIAYAKQRMAAGLPVFAAQGEQQYHIYPDLPRAGTPMTGFNDAAIRPMPSHGR